MESESGSINAELNDAVKITLGAVGIGGSWRSDDAETPGGIGSWLRAAGRLARADTLIRDVLATFHRDNSLVGQTRARFFVRRGVKEKFARPEAICPRRFRIFVPCHGTYHHRRRRRHPGSFSLALARF